MINKAVAIRTRISITAAAPVMPRKLASPRRVRRRRCRGGGDVDVTATAVPLVALIAVAAPAGAPPPRSVLGLNDWFAADGDLFQLCHGLRLQRCAQRRIVHRAVE